MKKNQLRAMFAFSLLLGCFLTARARRIIMPMTRDASAAHSGGVAVSNSSTNTSAAMFDNVPLQHQGKVRRCFELSPGDSVVVHAVRQRYGTGSFLVARPVEGKKSSGGAPLQGLLEALMDGCWSTSETATSGGQSAWFADAGAGDGEADALASSLGCAVLAMQPSGGQDARSLEMNRCINEDSNPFTVLPAMATASSIAFSSSAAQPIMFNAQGAHALTDTSKPKAEAPGIALDALFSAPVSSPPPAAASVQAIGNGSSGLFGGVSGMVSGMALQSARMTSDGRGHDFSAGEVALLKITPHRCCGQGSAQAAAALQGAVRLLHSGRVRCALTEVDFEPNGTEALLEVLKGIELMGYRLFHTGPLDAPEVQVTAKEGAYPVYKTDVSQLKELFGTLKRIRRFDERSGLRAYTNGVSLNREGKYFDYSDLVVACRGELPKRIAAYEKADFKFKDGMWWPEKAEKKTKVFRYPSVTYAPARRH